MITDEQESSIIPQGVLPRQDVTVPKRRRHSDPPSHWDWVETREVINQDHITEIVHQTLDPLLVEVRTHLDLLQTQQKDTVDTGNSLILHLKETFDRFQAEQSSMQLQMKKDFAVQLEQQGLIQKLGQEQIQSVLATKNLSQNVQTGFRNAEDVFVNQQRLIDETILAQTSLDSVVQSQIPRSAVTYGSNIPLDHQPPVPLIDFGSNIELSCRRCTSTERGGNLPQSHPHAAPSIDFGSALSQVPQQSIPSVDFGSTIPQVHHPSVHSVDRSNMNMDVFPGLTAAHNDIAVDRRLISPTVGSPNPVPCFDRFASEFNYHPSAVPEFNQSSQSVPPRPVPPVLRSHEEQMRNPMTDFRTNINNSPAGPTPIKLVPPPDFSSVSYHRWKKKCLTGVIYTLLFQSRRLFPRLDYTLTPN